MLQTGVRTIQKLVLHRPGEITASSSGVRPKTDMFTNYVFRKDLQRLIYKYNSEKKHFTLDNLLTDARGSLEFMGGRTSLFKILKSMGYKFNFVNGRKILCEQKYVVASKIFF